jgi:hypothetical protein
MIMSNEEVTIWNKWGFGTFSITDFTWRMQQRRRSSDSIRGHNMTCIETVLFQNTILEPCSIPESLAQLSQ